MRELDKSIWLLVKVFNHVKISNPFVVVKEDCAFKNDTETVLEIGSMIKCLIDGDVVDAKIISTGNQVKFTLR